jgi:hypothetical protein
MHYHIIAPYFIIVQVCEYAMATYTDVPLSRRRKLLEMWVKCKLLLQQSIPIRTYGIGEVSINILLTCTGSIVYMYNPFLTG